MLQALLFRMSEHWNFSDAGALLESKGFATILIDSGEEPAVEAEEGRKIKTHTSSHSRNLRARSAIFRCRMRSILRGKA